MCELLSVSYKTILLLQCTLIESDKYDTIYTKLLLQYLVTYTAIWKIKFLTIGNFSLKSCSHYERHRMNILHNEFFAELHMY